MEAIHRSKEMNCAPTNSSSLLKVRSKRSFYRSPRWIKASTPDCVSVARLKIDEFWYLLENFGYHSKTWAGDRRHQPYPLF